MVAGVNEGATGLTTSCEIRWQFLSCGALLGSFDCGGQWQCAGSGQQHFSLTVSTVRSCETGIAIATMIATM